jgi:glycosyltransferase involved in cell wall biosynthesis
MFCRAREESQDEWCDLQDITKEALLMRILTLTNLYPNPYQPHQAAFNRQLFRALAAEHQVEVIAPIAWTVEYSARVRGTTQATLASDRKRVSDGMIVHHPSYAFTPKVLRGWHGKFFLRSVRGCFGKVVRDFRPDVVLSCWAYPDGWAGVRLAHDAGLPVAVKVQGSDLLHAGDHPTRKRLTSETLSAADAVIAVSQNLREKAIAMGADPARTHVIYRGVDTSLFHHGSSTTARTKLGLPTDEPLLLFVGNLVPVKGADILLDALARLRLTSLRFKCVLIGEGPQRSWLQARIASLGLNQRVKLVGQLPLEQLPHWYRAADLVVLPSRSEGLPNVLRESIACGTPFIASRVGGIPEIASEDSLFPPGDSSALAIRLASFLASGRYQSTTPKFRPGSWREAAADLASVLRRIVNVSSELTCAG